MLSHPDIRHLSGLQLAGLRTRMSLAENQTPRLFRELVAYKGRVPFPVQGVAFSVEVYDSLDYFRAFDPRAAFEKWAAYPWDGQGALPDGLASITIPDGLYAVFIYRGSVAGAAAAYGQIFGAWLPGSGYALDLRPHFSCMPPGYQPHDPEAEEEIWIPVRGKA